VNGVERYAVVSCHAERPLDDATWTAFERLLRRRPGGFVVTPMLRPPADGEDQDVWLERARVAATLAPLGHHTHWGGEKQARPAGSIDAAVRVRDEAAWLREHELDPRYFCGGGWYLDTGLAELLAELGYVDCTATSFRPPYLAEGAPRLHLDRPTFLELPSGRRLLELPSTHSIGMLVRALPRRLDEPLVHVYFHDTDLLDRRRALALRAALRVLALRRTPSDLDAVQRGFRPLNTMMFAASRG
jgi:hypothetical protein